MKALLCDRVVGRYDGPADASHVDWLDLRWDECHRRAHAKQTRGGRPVRLLLRLGAVLTHGDVLHESSDCLLVVNVLPCEVIVVRPRDARQAAIAALELGNLHVPVEVTALEIITPDDGPARGVLQERNIGFTVEYRRLHPLTISGVTWSIAADGAAMTINMPARPRI